ncbi:MAG: hypothetical protein DRP70_16640, partial [Spirochaetes bacterium]
MFSGNPEEIRSVFRRLHKSESLPDFADLNRILDAVNETLSNENPLIRPRDSSKAPGGLLLLNPNITTVLVPDLHARTGYITSLIDLEISGKPVLERLA